MLKINNILKAGDGRMFISVILLVVAVLAIFFLTMAVSPKKNEQSSADSIVGKAKPELKNNPVKVAVDPIKLENDYKTQTSAAIRNFLDLDSGQKLNHAEIEKIKNGLLALRVPTKFKDLHIGLVMAMVKMDIFFQDGKPENKLLSEKTIDDARLKYNWLN